MTKIIHMYGSYKNMYGSYKNMYDSYKMYDLTVAKTYLILFFYTSSFFISMWRKVHIGSLCLSHS